MDRGRRRQIGAETTLRRTERAVHGDLPEETVLLDVDAGTAVRLNSTGAWIWEQLRAAAPGRRAGPRPGRALRDRRGARPRRRRRLCPRDGRAASCSRRLRASRRAPARAGSGPRGSCAAPAARRRPTRSRARRRPSPAPRTPPGASSATTGRWFSVGRRYWPTVSTWTRCSRRMPKVSTISSKDSPRPTISPDLVTTSLAAHLLRHLQHPGRAQELGAAARHRVEPRHRLDVVVEDVGTLVDHLGQRHLLAAEVGGEDLDLAARAPASGSSGSRRRRRSPRSRAGRRGRPR